MSIETKPEVGDLIPIKDYAYGDEYTRGQKIDLVTDDDILSNIDNFDRDLALALMNEDKLYSMGLRYAKCQSKILWKLAFHKIETEKIKSFQLTCDNRFCDCPQCVKRRKSRLIERYKPVLESLFNPNPRSRVNLRGLELTSDIEYTSTEDLDRFTKEMRKFLSKEKRVFKFIAGIHIQQSKIHAHIVYHGFFIPGKDLSQKWKEQTGWSNTNIKSIKGGIQSHLGHITKYLAQPVKFQTDNIQDIVLMIKDLYHKRLFTSSGIKPVDLPISEWTILPGEFISERMFALIFTYRNNSTSQSVQNPRSSIDFYIERSDYG